MRNGEIEFSWGCLNRKVAYAGLEGGYFDWSKGEPGAAVRMSNFLVYGCLTMWVYGCLTSVVWMSNFLVYGCLTSWCTDV